MVIPTKKWALYPESIDSLLFNSICRFVNLSGGRASGPVVGAAFKAVEVRLRAWWVRLLPLPPTTPIYERFRGLGHSMGPFLQTKVLFHSLLLEHGTLLDGSHF